VASDEVAATPVPKTVRCDRTWLCGQAIRLLNERLGRDTDSCRRLFIIEKVVG
jgi:hypothetical protein